MSRSELTPQEQIFISEYLTHFDRARAAKESNISKSDNHYAVGYSVLQRPHVRQQLVIELAQRDADNAVDALYIVEKLVQVVETDLVEWMLLGEDEQANIEENLKKMPPEVRKLVTGFEKEIIYKKNGDKVTKYRLKFMDKNSAIQLLGKYKGLFDKRVQVDLNVTSYVDWAEQMRREREQDIIKRQKFLEEQQQRTFDARFTSTDSDKEV